MTDTAYTVKALAPETWTAFADLVERQGRSSFGPPACWCLWFHSRPAPEEAADETSRDRKHRLVEEGRAHAALVFDGDAAVGWCQYGSPEELPMIYHRKEYDATTTELPDYRLTCFYVDKKYRHRGVAVAALRGALDLIAAAGGGVVEAYPRDTQGDTKVSSSFLYSATRALFEQAGFTYDRPKGKFNCIMVVTIPPGSP
ncbi:MAG: GNAT family N-acetyltransferase [Dermatophilaceae bacterium]